MASIFLKNKKLTEHDLYAKASDAEVYYLCLTSSELEDLLAGRKICSPLREKGDEDSSPSLNLFQHPSGRLMYYDWGTKEFGDAISFYQRMSGIRDRVKAISKIDEELGLQINGSVAKGIPRKHVILPFNAIKESGKEIMISVVHKPFSIEGLAFWSRWDIDVATLKKFNVYEVNVMYFDDKLIRPNSLCFAYKIGSRYKLYQPYDKEFKWRNNYSKNLVEGLWQIRDSKRRDLLIITKALKECMYYDLIGIDAICEKSESQVMNLELIELLQKRYKRIVVILDNDKAGISTMKTYESLGLETRHFVSDKNITDLHESKGKEFALFELQMLLDS